MCTVVASSTILTEQPAGGAGCPAPGPHTTTLLAGASVPM
jgi:hypothetical protein